MYKQHFDEINNVVAGKKIRYSGAFNLKELVVFIDTFFKKRGYEKLVMIDREEAFKSGKSLHVRLRYYWERKGKDVRFEYQIWLNIEKMKDVVKEVDGKKQALQQGDIDITFDAFLVTNDRGKWERRAEYIFIRTLFDKFLMRQESKDYSGMVGELATEFFNELYSYINLNKYIYK